MRLDCRRPWLGLIEETFVCLFFEDDRGNVCVSMLLSLGEHELVERHGFVTFEE